MRDKDIVKTLKHAEAKRQELLSLMFDAKFQGTPLENVSNLVGDILSNLTKCFDYCAKDIYEKYIENKDLSKKSGKIYFPFYKNQLVSKNKPFNALLVRKKIVFDFLLELARKAEIGEFLEETRIPYAIVRETRDLVNTDKHNKITEVDQQGRPELLAQSDIGKITIPEQQLNQNGWRVEVFPDQNKTTVTAKSFRLIANNQEVANFCTYAQIATEKILDKIYRKFLGMKIVES